MARWYDNNGNLVEDDTLEISVSKQPRVMDGPPPGMEIAGARRLPIVDGMTIDQSLMAPDRANPRGQFQRYEQFDTRRVGDMPGGERSVVTDAGADRFMTPGVNDRSVVADGADRLLAADRRLMGDGYGGVMVRDGIMKGTDQDGNRVTNVMNPEGFTPIRTNDQRIAMSPEAVGAIGNRQIMEDQAVTRDPFTFQQKQQRLSLRKELQAQADQGFLPAGTDARNREIMRGTEARQAGQMLERSRPKDMMTRRNTADQIMTQADASLMTPQVQTQDGVMAGWDPIRKQIVSDSSGAKAIAGARVQDKSLAGEDDKTILDQISKMTQRKNGKLDENQAIVYSGLMNSDPKKAAEYKQAIVGTWTPEDDQIYKKYIEHGVSRGLISTQKPEQDVGNKPGSKYEKMKR